LIPSGVHDAQSRFCAQLKDCLPDDVADELARHSTPVNYIAGSILVLQGSPADVLFWITSGIVKVYCSGGGDNRILLRLAGAGEMFGYPAFPGREGGMLQPYELEALTRCTVAMVPRETLMKAIRRLDQSATVAFFEHLNQHLSVTVHRLATFLRYSFRKRLEVTFRDLASKFGIEEQRGILLNLKLSHMDFAEMIGSSGPMATVLVGEMVDEGTLCRQGYHQYLVPRSSPMFLQIKMNVLDEIHATAKPTSKITSFERAKAAAGPPRVQGRTYRRGIANGT